jgi:hypothetical protein
MDVRVLRSGIDYKGILKEVNSIRRKYDLEGENQISLQSSSSDANPSDWDCSIGKLNRLSYDESKYIHPIFKDMPLTNHYISSLNAFRCRIMISDPKGCMSMHRDASPRIHLPVKTNKDCLMIIDGKCYHLEAGNCYLTDTTKYHTALNASRENRIHIIGCVNDR